MRLQANGAFAKLPFRGSRSSGLYDLPWRFEAAKQSSPGFPNAWEGHRAGNGQ